MERHQAGQEDTLVEVNVDRERLDLIPQPTASPADCHRCFKCVVALATAMGLVIAAGLVVGFVLPGVMSKTTCKQDAGPSRYNETFNMTSKLKESAQDTYEIFTADKAAKYLIYGWVKCSTDEDSIALMHTWDQSSRIIQKTSGSCREVYFFNETQLFQNSKVTLFFNSGQPNCTEGLFHVYEL